MKTIEFNSISDAPKSIELIIDGVSNPYPAVFFAIPQPGNSIVIKSEKDLISPIFVTDLSLLKVDGNPVDSKADAIKKINELANFHKGGPTSVNNGGENCVISEDIKISGISLSRISSIFDASNSGDAKNASLLLPNSLVLY